MPRFDVTKITIYVIAIGAALSVAALTTILKPWGLSDAAISIIAARVGSIVAAATLVTMVFNALKNPSPAPGMVSVTAPSDAALPLKAKDLNTAPPAADAAPKVGK